MSSEGFIRKECVVKKLDFENCVVASVQTRARGKTKLRARITREVKNLEKTPIKEKEICKKLLANSPVSSRETSRIFSVNTSPVLMRNQQECVSPVLLSNQRLHLTNKITQEYPQKVERTEDSTINYFQSSPVFKPKVSKTEFINTSKIESELRWNNEDTGSQNIYLKNSKSLLDRINNCDIVASQISVASNQNSQRFSFKIDEQDSVDIFKISSFESSENHEVSNPGSYLIDTKSDSKITTSDSTDCSTSDPDLNCSNLGGDNNEPVRRSHKKNSLLGRLQKLLRKQSSVKLLWQHQKRDNTALNSKKVSVIAFWNYEPLYILKCHSLGVVSENNLALFLVVNSGWVPCIRNIQKGSVLQVYPPWHTLYLRESEEVLVNVICLEILDEVCSPLGEKISLQKIPYDPDEFTEKKFIESFFSSRILETFF